MIYMYLNMLSAKWRPFCLTLSVFIVAFYPQQKGLWRFLRFDIKLKHKLEKKQRYFVENEK